MLAGFYLDNIIIMEYNELLDILVTLISQN
jgi:hypothetical protein